MSKILREDNLESEEYKRLYDLITKNLDKIEIYESVEE
jgi:hypothetical protein